MRFVILLLMFIPTACAQTPAEKIFAKYDFTKLHPQSVDINFKKISVTVWDRCSRCDCPSMLFEGSKEMFLKEIEGVTYRETFQIIDGPRSIKATKQDDTTSLSSRTEDECKIDSIITYVDAKPVPPCDPDCAKPATVAEAAKTQPPSGGCQSTGSTWFLLLNIFVISLIRRKVIKEA